MRRILFLICMVVTTMVAWAQDQVSNIRVEQQDNTVLITYDLESNGFVKLYYSIDNGATFSEAVHVSGAVGELQAAKDYSIRWEGALDAGYFTSDYVVFKFAVAPLVAESRRPTTLSRVCNSRYNTSDIFSGPIYPMELRGNKLYMNDVDITDNYMEFLRYNDTNAYKKYKKTYNSLRDWGSFFMVIGGLSLMSGVVLNHMLTLDIVEEDAMNTVYRPLSQGLMYGGGACIAVGIPILACMKVSPMRRAAKVYNTDLKMGMLSQSTPMLLRLGAAPNGLSLGLTF